jgi:amino acid transporter
MTLRQQESSGKLLRRVNLFWLVLYGLGTTIGAGIYVLIGKVAGAAGVLAPVSFLIAAALAGMTALSFAELGSRFPKSAGEALYVRKAFRSANLSLFVGLAVAVAGIVSAGAIVNGAAGYLTELLPLDDNLVVIAVTIFISGVAIWGIAESVVLAGIVTLIEIAGLLVIVGAGLFDVNLSTPAKISSDISQHSASIGLGGVLGGSLLAFYAFIGFEDMVNVAEEVRDVRRVLPIAIIITLGATTLLYLAVSYISISVLPIDVLYETNAPLALVWERASGMPSGPLVSVAVIATLNGALVQIIMASRVCYGLARQGTLPSWLANVSPVTHTPWISTFLVTGLVLVFALLLPIEQLAGLTSAITLSIFLVVNLSLWRIKMRERGKVHRKGFQVPAFWPLVAAAATIIFGAASVFASM